MGEHLAAFTRVARNSREYQGHGWGCAWLEDGRWRLYHDIRPIWEDDWRPPGRTTLLLAHARSAFRDEGIRVENNMPFHDGERVFIFNGELHGGVSGSAAGSGRRRSSTSSSVSTVVTFGRRWSGVWR